MLNQALIFLISFRIHLLVIQKVFSGVYLLYIYFSICFGSIQSINRSEPEQETHRLAKYINTYFFPFDIFYGVSSKNLKFFWALIIYPGTPPPFNFFFTKRLICIHSGFLFYFLRVFQFLFSNKRNPDTLYKNHWSHHPCSILVYVHITCIYRYIRLLVNLPRLLPDPNLKLNQLTVSSFFSRESDDHGSGGATDLHPVWGHLRPPPHAPLHVWSVQRALGIPGSRYHRLRHRWVMRVRVDTIYQLLTPS